MSSGSQKQHERLCQPLCFHYLKQQTAAKKKVTRKERVSAPLGRHLLPVQMRR